MFLDTMNEAEIIRASVNDREFLERNMLRFEKDIRQIAKRRRPYPLLFHRSVKSGYKNEYLIIGSTDDGQRFFGSPLAVLYSSNGLKTYARIKPDFNGYLHAYSPHLLDRYMLRFLKTETDLDNAVTSYFVGNKVSARIYSKNLDEDRKDVVFVINDGMVMGTAYEREGIIILKTFISDSMLNTSQRVIKDDVIQYLPKYPDGLLEKELLLHNKQPELKAIYETFANDEIGDYLRLKKSQDEKNIRLNFTLKSCN